MKYRLSYLLVSLLAAYTPGLQAQAPVQVEQKVESKPISTVAVIPTALNPVELENALAQISRNVPLESSAGQREYLSRSGKLVAGCRFPADDSAFSQQFMKGRGLMAPVFRQPIYTAYAGSASDQVVDWIATEKLHRAMSNDAHLNLLPIAESRRYWGLLKDYIETKINEDAAAYLGVAKAGGGIFGQLFGQAMDKDGAFSKVSDPNRRLSGFTRVDFYENLLKSFPDADYLISSNEAVGIAMYYDVLQVRIWKGLDEESLKLNLQKDVRGTARVAAEAARLYYYGVIDEKRVAESSTLTLLATSALKINLHTDLSKDGFEKVRAEREIVKRLVDFEGLLQELRQAVGFDFSVSLVEKYKTLKYVGVDKERIFCGGYDAEVAAKLTKIIDRISVIRKERTDMLNPLIFQFKVMDRNYEQDRDAQLQEIRVMAEEVKAILQNIPTGLLRIEDTFTNNFVGKAFLAAGYSGFVQSQKLK